MQWKESLEEQSRFYKFFLNAPILDGILANAPQHVDVTALLSVIPIYVIEPLSFLDETAADLNLIDEPEQFFTGANLFAVDDLTWGMLGPYGLHTVHSYLDLLFNVLIRHCSNILNVHFQRIIARLQRITVAAYSLVRWFRYTNPRYIWESSGAFQNFLILYTRGESELKCLRVSCRFDYLVSHG